MEQRFIRTEALYGSEKMLRLKNCKIALFGIGGVGSYAFESLIRSGVGNIDIFDNDTVKVSNINRQLIATENQIGNRKIDAAINRAKEINPEAVINGYDIFYLPNCELEIDFSKYDYIIDAIDTVTAKIDIIVKAKEANTTIISVMGTGNKTDPTLLRIDDISTTNSCPLAKVMRSELKKRNIKDLTVIWSPEEPKKPHISTETDKNGRNVPASSAIVPSAAGIFAASVVINNL